MRLFALLPALALFALVPAPAFAQQPVQTAASASLNPEDMPEVKQAEDFLNSITTVKAKFIQTANDGKQLTGQFYLKRPGHMRFQYDPPVTDFIVADGTLIYYYDGQMKQQKNTLISQTLANFFLRKDLKLSGDIRVTEVKRADNLLLITLSQAKQPLSGTMTLGFTENPMTLKKWVVVDAQGLTTQVELFDQESGIKLDSDLFHYYDPQQKKSQYN